MNEILSYFLTQVLIYGYPIIALLILGSEVGLPLPTSTILMAAGSFTINGELNFYWLIALATLTSIGGDLLGYKVGMKYKDTIEKNFLAKIGLDTTKLNLIKNALQKGGGYLVFFSRWLLLPIGVPVNLLAGINSYSFSKFLLAVVLGESFWAFVYVYLGYLFGANWTSLVTIIGTAPKVFTLAFVGLVILFYGYKLVRRK